MSCGGPIVRLWSPSSPQSNLLIIHRVCQVIDVELMQHEQQRWTSNVKEESPFLAEMSSVCWVWYMERRLRGWWP